jgi:hypothetical protein
VGFDQVLDHGLASQVCPLAQKGSIGLAGELFEVRTVARDLTTVSRVDRRLGLIKNLGVTTHKRAYL